jgi:uroporphyrinogen decarboxylase
MKKMYQRAKSAGRYVFQHSCGYIEDIFPDLIEIGLDCYQTFQPELYDIEKVKDTYGGSLTFWGGLSTQRLLPYAPPEKIRSETARIMRIMGKNGGYIAAPTHAMPGDIPLENILAMLDVFENQESI